MAKLMIRYRAPEAAAAFDRYYLTTHVPLARSIPGLVQFETSHGPVTMPNGPAIHRVAILQFSSLQSLRAALASPEGQAAKANIGNFADGGADLMFFDTAEF